MSCRVLMGRTGAGRPCPASLERGKEHTGYYREKGGGGLAILGWSQWALSRATKCASRLRLALQRTLPALSRSTPSHPTNLRGGGVGDCATRRSAGGALVRGDHRGRKRQFDRLGQLLSNAARGRVNDHGQLPAGKSGRPSGNNRVCVGEVHVAGGKRGPVAGDFRGGGAERRNALHAYPRSISRRCGRDDHHLPALTTESAGGGIAK